MAETFNELTYYLDGKNGTQKLLNLNSELEVIKFLVTAHPEMVQ